MPTYQNSTDKRIQHKGLKWEPGEEKALSYFVPFTMLGLTVVNEEPFVLKGSSPRGFGMAELTVIGPEMRYDIPYNDAVEISVWISAGSTVTMYAGDSDISVPLDTASVHISRYPWEMVGYLRFEGTGTVYVKTEPFTNFGTEGKWRQ